MKIVKCKLQKVILIVTALVSSTKAFAVASLSDAETSISTQANAAIGICKIAIGVVLAISLVVIIYHISQGSHRSKEALIGWFVAVAVYCIGLSILGK